MELVNRVPVPSVRTSGRHVVCYSEAWGQGGIETFLMELFRRLQGRGFSFTLFSTWDWNDGMDGELHGLGIDRWTRFPDRAPGQLTRLRGGSAAFGSLIDLVGCDVAYVNTENGMGFLWSEVARRHGVATRVVHSHNSAFRKEGAVAAKAIAHEFGRKFLGGSATARLAVSQDAGRYLFDDRPFEIVNNGVDTARFAFDAAARRRLRAEYGVPDDVLLFGSVGRIFEIKNPLFQIRAFAEIRRREPDARYLMVGDGEMRQEVEGLVSELGLSDAVIMAGYLPDPAPAYSALDCFLLPSFYEGLATVRIEAQCSGCPVLGSDALPAEGGITDAEELLPLSAGEAAWAERAIRLARTPRDRAAYAGRVRAAGFDADSTAARMAEILGGKA